MSITTYQTLAARELLDAIVWPEWEDKYGFKHMLCYHEPFGIAERTNTELVSRLDAHVALCLLRNHLREFIWAWIARAPVCPYDDDALLAACEEALAEHLAEEADDGNTA